MLKKCTVRGSRDIPLQDRQARYPPMTWGLQANMPTYHDHPDPPDGDDDHGEDDEDSNGDEDDWRQTMD